MDNNLLYLISKIQTNLFVLKKQKHLTYEFLELLDINSSERSLLENYFYIFENSLFNIDDDINSLINEILELDPSIFAVVSGKEKINNINYRYEEIRFGGTDRGLKYTADGYSLSTAVSYKISPDPHNNSDYNNSPPRFYASMSDRIERIGTPAKWTPGNWPRTINVKVSKENYTLTKQ